MYIVFGIMGVEKVAFKVSEYWVIAIYTNNYDKQKINVFRQGILVYGTLKKQMHIIYILI